MSFPALGQAINFKHYADGTKMRQVDKAILMYITYRYNDEIGYAWAGIERIADDCCTSKPTLLESLKRLGDGGLIEVVATRNAIGGRSNNRYYLPWFKAGGDRPEVPSLSKEPLQPEVKPASAASSKEIGSTIKEDKDTIKTQSPKGDSSGCLSLTAQRVLEAHRDAYGRSKRLQPNPTLAARLETACTEYGEDALKKAVEWAALKEIPFPNLIASIRGAKKWAEESKGGDNGRANEGGSRSTQDCTARSTEPSPFAAWDD